MKIRDDGTVYVRGTYKGVVSRVPNRGWCWSAAVRTPAMRNERNTGYETKEEAAEALVKAMDGG
jgi:hypothetical protein